MVQWSKALDTLAEDPSSQHPHWWLSTNAYNSSEVVQPPLLPAAGTSMNMVHIWTCMHV